MQIRRGESLLKIIKVVEDCHKLIAWLIPVLDKFPRVRRYTLGEHIEQGLLVVLELLIEAEFAKRSKMALIAKANTKLSVVRHLWRLAYELKVISHKAYQYGAIAMVDIGKQMGGWQKQVNQP